MKLVLSFLNCGGHHEVGAKMFTLLALPLSECSAVYTVGVAMKQVQSCLYCGGNHEAGAKLFTLWESL